jgi:hypothetical protein
MKPNIMQYKWPSVRCKKGLADLNLRRGPSQGIPQDCTEVGPFGRIKSVPVSTLLSQEATDVKHHETSIRRTASRNNLPIV